MQTAAEVPRRAWIGGFPISDMSTEGLVALINARRSRRLVTELHFANTNFIVGCRDLRDALCDETCVIVNDGIGMDIACRWLHGRAFTANLNGTDFTPRLLAGLEEPARVFLIGSTSDAVRKAASLWARLPQVEIVGAVDGFEGAADDEALLENLARVAPDILLVALGNPRQEAWIVSHRKRHPATLVIGVGALFDFVSGRSKRAPMFVRRLRLEWLHRLAFEPRRLAKRYTIDIARFFMHCARTRDVTRVAGPR